MTQKVKIMAWKIFCFTWNEIMTNVTILSVCYVLIKRSCVRC